MLYFAGYGEDFGSFGGFGAERGIPVGPFVDDVTNIAKGLDVVDVCRFAP